MAIIPCVRCSRIAVSIDFYTQVLDFIYVGGDDVKADPSFCVLRRGADLLFLSSHRGDGSFGQVVHITVDDVQTLFRNFRARGLETPGDPGDPKEVHEGPIQQSWGTREFYVQDPDRNTLRFMQGFGT